MIEQFEIPESPKQIYPYELFFDLSPDLLCIAGFDGYFKKVNKAVTDLLGYTTEELYTKPINEFVFHSDKEITTSARTALTNKMPLLHFENRYMTKSGQIVWLSWTSLPIETDKLVFAIAKNITYKKQLEEERNRMLSQLTTLNNDLKQLTYTTSHDLRSPVNNLLSIFSLIDLSKIEDEETVSLLDILKTCSEGLKNTLNNYIDRISNSETIRSNVEVIDFEECLSNVLVSIHSSLKASNATLNIDFSTTPATRFNKACMESIFLNLLTNAIKYARPGVPPTISIYSKVEEGKIQLVVRDNGRGFDLEKIGNRLFGFHQQFHDQINNDSKGIGLYLVHNHVTNLGGKIGVESAMNKGTTFTITFRNDQ